MLAAAQGWDVAIGCRQDSEAARSVAAEVRALCRQALVLPAAVEDEAAVEAMFRA